MAFDKGEKWEAVRIATAVYLLVRDEARTRPSLLTQSGHKQAMAFLATGMPMPPSSITPIFPLTQIHFVDDGQGTGSATVLPMMASFSMVWRLRTFKEWWEDDAVYSGGLSEKSVNREDLTWTLRNKEGGGHFGKFDHDDDYLDMKRPVGEMLFTTSGGVEIPIIDRELATMRQIGWELLFSMGLCGVLGPCAGARGAEWDAWDGRPG